MAILIFGCVWQSVHKTDSQSPKQAATIENANLMEKCEKQTFAMDTYMTFSAYGENAEAAVDAAIEEVKRLDAMLSTGNASSEISVLNTKGEAAVSDDTRTLLERSLEIHKKTDGLFDISIYPLMELWGFPSQQYHVALEEEIRKLLPCVNAADINIEGNHISLHENQKIDLGAIAKGYTSARLIEIYKQHGLTSGMVYLGGNVQTLGTKPDGTKWNIGIQNPSEEQGEVLMAVKVQDQAVITSGGYERYFEEDGKTYIHILDPRTGKPVENDLLSVTIISEDGALADALSTSLFIMGKEEAAQFWRENYTDFQMILVTKEQEIFVTEGLQNEISCKYDYQILTR